VYLSGIVQAHGIELAIIAQRTAKPRCYGTLYWQFNDAWPAISWSSIDYYGRWKPLQYYAKRMYANIAIFVNNKVQVICINDNLYPVDVIAKILLLKFDGTILLAQ
jgi:beta-mannosidase